MLTSKGRDLFYHIWEREGSSHYYEIDFLTSQKTKLIPMEVKSSATGKHESISKFCEKYSEYVDQAYLVSQKDVKDDGKMKCIPVYMLPFVFE